MTNVPLVILLGILSTIQTHLAKALERQGIEVFDQLRLRLGGSTAKLEGGVKKPVIYTVGILLNHTTFLYALAAQPFGPPALFTSMFGVGLVALMLYAWKVLHEPLRRSDVAGSAAILLGTLLIGLENITRQDYQPAGMRVQAMLLVAAVFVILGAALCALAYRQGQPAPIGLAFGLLAGGLGGLDPFLKGVAQTEGGRGSFLPVSWLGGAIFASSFVIGFLAFLVTQVGFARKAHASRLVPVYNSTFILLPLLLQVVLLPGYPIYWTTLLGVALIISGILLVRSNLH